MMQDCRGLGCCVRAMTFKQSLLLILDADVIISSGKSVFTHQETSMKVVPFPPSPPHPPLPSSSSAFQAQHHPWLNPTTGNNVKICEDAINNLKNFRQTNYLKKLALELVARSLDSEQIRNLEQCFVTVSFARMYVCAF